MAIEFLNPGCRYRPVAFWFLNHYLEECELERQLRSMAEQGMGGVMLHARDGMRTDYLSADFARCLEHAIKVAAELGMQVWLYDEFHYPSGAAGHRMNLTAAESMQTLKVVGEYTAHPGETVTPGGALAYASSCVSGETRELRSGEAWRVPGEWGAAKIFELEQESWQANPVSVFDRFPDYTDPELTARFIDITHRWYFEHFGKYFGNTIRGIFSDNTCGNFGCPRRSIPWGRDFAMRFREYTGEGIESHLPRLLDVELPGSERSRLLFWNFFEHAYLDNYFTPITDYCREHAIYSTGHLACEDGLGEHVRQIGSYFEVMRHFNYCAVDDLGPERVGDSPVRRSDDAGWLPQKLTASCARFLGRDEVMCECLGLAGKNWQLTLGEVRRITGWLAVAGVNVFVPHGLYYSIAGSRKWECAPDHLHTPAWRHYRHWSDWIARISLASTGGVNCAEVAVLYPVETLKVLVELGVEAASGDRGDADMAVEDSFRDTVNRLFAAHVDFEIVDEVLLQQSRMAEAGTMVIPAAKAEFDQHVRVLLLPSCRVLQRASQEKIAAFIAHGGTVIVLDQAPERVIEADSRVTSEPVPPGCRYDTREASGWLTLLPRNRELDNPLLGSRMWERDGARYLLICNPETTEQNATLTLPEAAAWGEVELSTGMIRRWEAEKLRLAPGSVMLLTTACPEERLPGRREPEREVVLPQLFSLSADRPNVAVLREWRTVAMGQWQRHLLEFQVEEVPSTLTLLLDLERGRNELAAGRFGARLICRVNGQKVPEFQAGHYLDRYIYESDISGLVTAGLNRIEIDCDALLHDWEWRLHPVMLAGDFGWRENRMTAPTTARSCRLGNWVADGYPFFAGTLRYQAPITLAEGDSVIRIPGAGDVVEVRLDGRSLGVCSGEPYRFPVYDFPGGAAELTVEFTTTNARLLE